MATMTATLRAERGATGGRPSREGGRARTVVVVLLACAGLMLAGLQAWGSLVHRDDVVPGEAVDTSFGSLTVTRTRTTFVPSTQGPPTMAKMRGATGTGQLQVWVRLANTEASGDIAYSADDFRLADAQGHRVRPDGSSLAAARLPRGAVVDGQVWFDLPSAAPDGVQRWLEFREPGGRTARIALPVQQATAPAPDGHEHEHENEKAHDH
jgi:hypothetical protein